MLKMLKAIVWGSYIYPYIPAFYILKLNKNVKKLDKRFILLLTI